MYLPGQYSDQTALRQRLDQFESAFKLLQNASIDHYRAIEKLSLRQPKFVSMNHLFHEVFIHTQKAVQGLSGGHSSIPYQPPMTMAGASASSSIQAQQAFPSMLEARQYQSMPNGDFSQLELFGNYYGEPAYEDQDQQQTGSSYWEPQYPMY